MTEHVLLAYFGPETTLPIASAFAVAAGFVLATARFVTGWFSRRLRFRERS